jgi:hypothetical protein
MTQTQLSGKPLALIALGFIPAIICLTGAVYLAAIGHSFWQWGIFGFFGVLMVPELEIKSK